MNKISNFLATNITQIHQWEKSPNVLKKEVATRITSVAVASPLAALKALYHGSKAGVQTIGLLAKLPVKVLLLFAPENAHLKKADAKLPSIYDLVSTAKKVALYVLSALSSFFVGVVSPSLNYKFQIALGVVESEEMKQINQILQQQIVIAANSMAEVEKQSKTVLAELQKAQDPETSYEDAERSLSLAEKAFDTIKTEEQFISTASDEIVKIESQLKKVPHGIAKARKIHQFLLIARTRIQDLDAEVSRTCVAIEEKEPSPQGSTVDERPILDPQGRRLALRWGKRIVGAVCPPAALALQAVETIQTTTSACDDLQQGDMATAARRVAPMAIGAAAAAIGGPVVAAGMAAYSAIRTADLVSSTVNYVLASGLSNQPREPEEQPPLPPQGMPGGFPVASER